MARYFRKGAEEYRIEGSVVEVVIFLCIYDIFPECISIYFMAAVLVVVRLYQSAGQKSLSEAVTGGGRTGL